MLKVRDLSVTFRIAGGRSVTAVDRLSFTIDEGAIFALVGESGSGKSVAALSLCGLAPQGDYGVDIDGSARLDGVELLELDRVGLSRVRR